MKSLIRISGLLILPVFVFGGVAIAQDNRNEDQPADAQRPAANQPQDVRGNMLRQLGLSREQIQQLRRINAERKPHMDAAQSRLRQATRSLDEAIYADQVNEGDVQARLKEMQLAQAEVFKIRMMNELAVRRLLTPEQLTQFRNMRQRFEQAREDAENRRNVNDRLPVKTPGAFQEVKPVVKPTIKPD